MAGTGRKNPPGQCEFTVPARSAGSRNGGTLSPRRWSRPRCADSDRACGQRGLPRPLANEGQGRGAGRGRHRSPARRPATRQQELIGLVSTRCKHRCLHLVQEMEQPNHVGDPEKAEDQAPGDAEAEQLSPLSRVTCCAGGGHQQLFSKCDLRHTSRPRA